MLLEEGRFALSDPISYWAPEFTDMRVLHSLTGSLSQTVSAQRPITFEDLLTDTGFTVANEQRHQVDLDFAHKMVKMTNSSCIFVRDSGHESVLA